MASSHGMRLAGTGANDPGWLLKIVRHPPESLSTLEYWVGPLDVDFAGGEGRGLVTRPPHDGLPRGALRRDVRHLSAVFRFDRFHERPECPRDMTLESVSLGLDMPAVVLERTLEATLGAGRELEHDRRRVLEFGQWFYVSQRDDGSGLLTVHRARRPEWALPAIAPGAHAALMARLVDALETHRRLDSVLSAIAPQLADANVAVRSSCLDFRPGIPVRTVTAALGWHAPVATSTDVHLSSWRVMPHAGLDERAQPHLGSWRIGVHLEGWPRAIGGAELPRLGQMGPAPLYDVRGCATPVSSLEMEPVLG